MERNMLIPRHIGVDMTIPAVKLESPRMLSHILTNSLPERVVSPIFAINPFSSKGAHLKGGKWSVMLSSSGALQLKILEK